MGINTNDCDELGILYNEATLSGRPDSRFTGYLYAKRLIIRQRILSPSDAAEKHMVYCCYCKHKWVSGMMTKQGRFHAMRLIDS